MGDNNDDDMQMRTTTRIEARKEIEEEEKMIDKGDGGRGERSDKMEVTRQRLRVISSF